MFFRHKKKSKAASTSGLLCSFAIFFTFFFTPSCWASRAASELSTVTAKIIDNKVQISVINTYTKNIKHTYQHEVEKLQKQRGLFLHSVSMLYKLRQRPKELLLVENTTKEHILTSFVVLNYWIKTTVKNIKLVYLQVDHIKTLLRQLNEAQAKLLALNKGLLHYKQKLDKLLANNSLGGFNASDLQGFRQQLSYNAKVSTNTRQFLENVSNPTLTPEQIKADNDFVKLNKKRLQLPQDGYIYRTYQDKRYKNKFALTYNGIVFIVLPHVQIRALADGKVLYIGAMHDYGNIIIIQHSPSWVSIISGNFEPQINLAQKVRQGEAIGQVTKNAQPIYFELDQKFNPVNLENWYH